MYFLTPCNFCLLFQYIYNNAFVVVWMKVDMKSLQSSLMATVLCLIKNKVWLPFSWASFQPSSVLEGGKYSSLRKFYRFSHLSEVFHMKTLDYLYLDTTTAFTVIEYKLFLFLPSDQMFRKKFSSDISSCLHDS